MNSQPDDIVRVYSGPLALVETYQQTLREAGIDSRVVGTELAGGFGSALPNATELWVHGADLPRAVELLAEEERAASARHSPA
ncbi:MAG: DUF2007 domain-containing protein [Gemmataceae bacterium]|nr:DUF2007 domain-containing protein [Gemmataceae bacterium]